MNAAATSLACGITSHNPPLTGGKDALTFNGMRWTTAASQERWIRLDGAFFLVLGEHSAVLAAVPIDESIDLDTLLDRLPTPLHPSDVRDILSELRLLGRVARVVRFISTPEPPEAA